MRIFFAIFGTLLVLAFLGVQPMANYKDTAIEQIGCSHSENGKTLPLIPEELIWVEDISISPNIPYFFQPIRLVTVKLNTSDTVFAKSSSLGYKVSLSYENYYYGYYRILLIEEEYIPGRSISVDFPVPSSEPVFQEGGKFTTNITSGPKWDNLWRSLKDTPDFWDVQDNPIGTVFLK